MQISYRLCLWTEYAHERNLPYEFARLFTTKRSLIECVRFFLIRKNTVYFHRDYAVYWRLEVYVDNYPEVISSVNRYRSLKRFIAFLHLFEKRAIEFHDLPF